ncbi:MAG: Gldg family protein, partial [Lysobacterales bacterium]
EYDLAKMISALGQPERKTMGLISSLPMGAGYDPATQGMREEWVVFSQLSQLFAVKNIDPQAGTLPDGIDVLVLVHPRNLGDSMLYQIDQFVLGGGRLLAFIDPLAESDRGDPNDPMAQMQAGSSSTLDPLLGAWGLKFNSQQVVGDLQYGIGNGQSRHIGILSVPGEGMNADDIVSADLEVVNLSSTGWLEMVEGAKTHVEMLVESSENAAPMDSNRLRFLSNPADLLRGFNPTGDRYALAVRISGPANSAFASVPEGADGSSRLAQSGDQGINVIIFADTDILTDRVWVQKQPFMGQTIVNAFADNGDLVVNAVDNLLGNRDLISIRTRASSVRPFDRVNALQVAAENEYRATEERLQQELAETERKLTELQDAKGGGDLMVLTEEQKAELQRFVDRKLEIRRDLRQVQHDLQSEIDRLGTKLKLVNIVLVPLLVLVVAALYGTHRR